jgi:hypothetical protein
VDKLGGLNLAATIVFALWTGKNVTVVKQSFTMAQ